MTHDERLKYMRYWLKTLEQWPEFNKQEIECLRWAIKQCQKNVDRKRDKEKAYGCYF